MGTDTTEGIEPLPPAEMEAWITAKLREIHGGLEMSDEDEATLATYSMYMMAAALIEKGVDIDTAIQCVEQASDRGDIEVSLVVEGGTQKLKIRIGEGDDDDVDAVACDDDIAFDDDSWWTQP